MKKTLLALGGAVAFAASFAVTGASAMTVSNVSGNVCEGGVAPAVASGCPTGQVLGDFNSNVSDPTLELVGDTRIWGGVAHRSRTQYFDSWTIDFGTSHYAGVFNWQRTSANFDGILSVGGTDYDIANLASGSFGIGTLTGVVQFVLNPLAGSFGPNPDEIATWDMELSQVPLPAGAWLTLTGLAGFAAMRRRKTR